MDGSKMLIDIITILQFILNFHLFKCEKREMEGFIVGGAFADIGDFPHSALLDLKCDEVGICGSSIVSQQALLTAAHCFETCDLKNKKHFIIARTGSRNKRQGYKSLVVKYLIHPAYDIEEAYNDIALVKLREPLRLGPGASRVALMRSPPTGQAFIAGWGLVDELFTPTNYLKYAQQPLIVRKTCMKLMQWTEMHPSWFCAGHLEMKDYPMLGDSGSALVVKGYIQIGVVSFRQLSLRSVTIYVNVSQYIDWIEDTIKMFYCSKP